MKKVILSLVFVLATGVSFINAKSADNEFIPAAEKAMEIVEEFGCARDCVDSSFELTIEEAEAEGGLVYMEDYLANYELCLAANCQIFS